MIICIKQKSYQTKLSNKVIKTINQAGCKKFVVLVDNETELVGTIRGLEGREKFALILGLLNNVVYLTTD